MDKVKKRFLLFLIGCIGSRFLLVYIAKNASTTILKNMGYLLLIPAFGFLYFYLSGTRKTGIETLGDPIWWNDLRPIHSVFYFGFCYNAIHGNHIAWVYLLADVLFGLSNFLWHYSSSFAK